MFKVDTTCWYKLKLASVCASIDILFYSIVKGNSFKSYIADVYIWQHGLKTSAVLEYFHFFVQLNTCHDVVGYAKHYGLLSLGIPENNNNKIIAFYSIKYPQMQQTVFYVS